MNTAYPLFCRHMGITVVDRSRGDLTKVVEGIKSVIQALPAKS